MAIFKDSVIYILTERMDWIDGSATVTTISVHTDKDRANKKAKRLNTLEEKQNPGRIDFREYRVSGPHYVE